MTDLMEISIPLSHTQTINALPSPQSTPSISALSEASLSIFVDRDYNTPYTCSIPQFKVPTSHPQVSCISPHIVRMNEYLFEAYDVLNKWNILDNLMRVATFNALPISTHYGQRMKSVENVVSDVNAVLVPQGYRMHSPCQTAFMHIEIERLNKH